MKISESAIAEIVKRGDSSTIYTIIRALTRNLNTRVTELNLHAQASAKLRKAFIETQIDRDRLRRMAEELLTICEESESSEKAQKVIASFGGLEGSKDSPNELSVELE